MAKKTKKRRLNSRLMRTVRKTSAAVLMATAIAVAAIPAGNIEAQDRETNTGVVVDDTRETYVYLGQVDGSDKDDRDEYKDSKSAPGTYYDSMNESGLNLSAYHRLKVAAEKAAEEEANREDSTEESIAAVREEKGPKEGVHYFRSYSVRQSRDGYYLNWQFAFKNNVLYEYNDNFAENVVELPYQVSTKYYQISQATYDYFYSAGHTGAEELIYTFNDWYLELDKDNPSKTSVGYTILTFFPSRYVKFSALCQEYINQCNAEIEDWKKECDSLEEQILQEQAKENPDSARIAQLQTQLDTLTLNKPKTADKRSETEQPKLIVDPSSDELSVQEKYRFFCAKFRPNVDGVGEDKNLPVLSSFASSLDFTLQFVTDESNGTSKGIYLVKYIGNANPELGVGAKLDSFGFLVTEFSNSAITAIGDYAFYHVMSIDTLILPMEIQYVGDYAFATSFMKTVQMPNVRTIGNAAFKGCGKLSSISMDTAMLSKIGAEAFYGCPITELTLPYSVERIGNGAFANCTSLKKLDFSAITVDCVIEEAAFFDAMSLTEVIFPPTTSQSIKSLGDGTFAVNLKNAPLHVELPANLSKLPKYLFAGRNNLQSVVMPESLGYLESSKSIVPNTTFMGCSSLQYVKFPDVSKFVSYEKMTSYTDADGNELRVFPLYLDVDNKDFYVEGPAYSTGTVEALERVDTWNCITNVNNFVPYVYQLDGVMYYEVSDGKYVMTANENGVLLTCRVIDDGTSLIDLVIPQKVGNYTIKTIADGCFNDEKLRARLRSITVENGTLQEISAGVFKNLPKLKWVDLGDSVEKIGDSAFEGCEALTDVTFRADQVTLGANAFVTHGDELTFHGKIASDFGPFVWAMQKDNFVKAKGVRLCYQSLSPSL